MKKIIYTVTLLAAVNTLHAQVLFNKLKNKVNSVTEKPQQQATATGTQATNYTDPAKFGTVIYTFSKAEMATHGGGDGYGFNMWFPSVNVANNQLDLQIADHDMALYSYSNGQFQKTSGKPDLSQQNKVKTGNEKELWSVDFTQTDQGNAMMKKGQHVASGMMPGKPEQTYTFNDKLLGNFMMAMVAHNADSSVVSVVGASLAGGMTYKMVTSNGQQLALPKKYGGRALISPDGKLSVALYQADNGMGFDVYPLNGAKFSISNFNNELCWLRNSGNVFNVEYSNPKALDKNGTLFHTFDSPVEPQTLFISADDQRMCWTARGLYFSDGTSFENGQSPHRVILNNKEVIIFLAVDFATGQLYLCQHDL